MNYLKLLSGSLVTFLLLQGCGESSDDSNPSDPGQADPGQTDSWSTYLGPTYSGLTSDARIDAASASDLTYAAVSGAIQVVTANELKGLSLNQGVSSSVSRLPGITSLIATSTDNSQTIYSSKQTDVSSSHCPGGGSAIQDINDSGTVTSLTFKDCVEPLGLVINGMTSITYNSTWDDFVFQAHIQVSGSSSTHQQDWTVSCTNVKGAPSCEISSDFMGVDPRIYRLTNASVTGNDVSGYNITATIYDPDQGSIQLTTSRSILYNCMEKWIPSTGAISITGSDGSSASISFVSCSQYTVVVDNVGTTYSW